MASLSVAVLSMAILCMVALSLPVPDPQIVALLALAEKSPDKTAIVTIEQQIITLLLAAGLAWTSQRIHHRQVGIHRCNRHGFGVSWSRFHRLGAKIFRIGFSWAAAASVICFEDDDEQTNAKFTIEQQAVAEGFGKQKLHVIKYAAVGGNHLNQLNVAICDGVPTSFASFSESGKMCKAKIAGKDPIWKEALEHGLKEWTVIHKHVPVMYPTLPNLIQRARNAVSQNNSGESIIEMLLEIHSISKDMQKKSGESPDWAALEQIVMQSEPPFAEHIGTMCNWVIKYGNHNLERLCDFIATSVPAAREIHPDILAAVFKWPTEVHAKDNDLLAELALAIVMAEYNCPPDKAPNGICSFLRPGKIFSLFSANKEGMRKANALLQAFRDWTKQIGLTKRWKTAYDGKLYCLIARMVLGIAVPESLEKAEFEAGCKTIADEVLALPPSVCEKALPAEHPWAAFALEDTSSFAKAASKPSGMLIDYNVDTGGDGRTSTKNVVERRLQTWHSSYHHCWQKRRRQVFCH